MSDYSFYNTLKYKLTLCVSTSVFFYLFLLFFLPFGVDNYNANHEYTASFLLDLFVFFSVVLIFSLLNEFVLRRFIVKNTSLKTIMFWNLWTFYLLASVVFLAYNFQGNWHDFVFKSYLEFLINVPMVIIFPVVGTFFYFKYRSLQYQMEHILTSKEEFIDTNQLIHFKGEGNKDQITLSISSFLYGEAQDNYVELHYVEQNKLKKFLIRSSLNNLTKSIDNTIIVRCHRSYMVNLLHVKSIKYLNKVTILSLSPFDSLIRVSKSYKDVVLDKLHTIKNFK